MSWFYLFLAIAFEVLGTSLMKLSSSTTNLKYTVIMIITYIISLAMLSQALKKIEIGVAYAIWSGLGIVAILIIGVVFFHESISWQKVFFVALIVIGAVGLNFSRAA